jgi:hypothetical protein
MQEVYGFSMLYSFSAGLTTTPHVKLLFPPYSFEDAQNDQLEDAAELKK